MSFTLLFKIIILGFHPSNNSCIHHQINFKHVLVFLSSHESNRILNKNSEVYASSSIGFVHKHAHTYLYDFVGTHSCILVALKSFNF